MKPFASDTKLARTFLILCAAGSMLMSCRNLPPNDGQLVTTTSGGGGNGSSSSGPAASISAGLYIKVSTQWEQTSTWLDVADCQVPLGTAPNLNHNQPCTMSVPEAKLHYSSVRFTVGTSDPTTCKIVRFYPYYYKGSNSNTFVPYWDPNSTTAFDCSATPGPGDCYNGPVKTLLSDFPKHNHKYFPTKFGLEASFDVDSANSKLQPGNLWVTNAISTTNGDRGSDLYVDLAHTLQIYAHDSMQDYVVTCEDEWGELQYRITLTLADEDTPSAQNPGTFLDNYLDWNDFHQ